MERIEVLIDKLVAQNHNGSTPAQLLMTVHLLQNELMLLQQNSKPAGSKKVSVIMPTNNVVAAAESKVEAPEAMVPKIDVLRPVVIKQMKINLEDNQPFVEKSNDPISLEKYGEKPKPQPVEEEKPQPVEKVEAPLKSQPSSEINESYNREEPKSEPYFLRRPEVDVPPIKEDVKVAEIKIDQSLPHFPFDAMAETPTLLQQQPPSNPKEVHELIGDRKESLNDRLKQEKTEVVHQLKESPVKDLRKAVGINDKFLFVNELFRGDEGMYERSIKTINNFHILPEAEYWMNRELKVKLGWNDSKDTVQHFYSLVRRRFS